MTEYPVDFPFVATYVDTFVEPDGKSVVARQRVEVLERFGMNYRVRGVEDLRIPGLRSPLPAGLPTLVKTQHIRPLGAGESE